MNKKQIVCTINYEVEIHHFEKRINEHFKSRLGPEKKVT